MRSCQHRVIVIVLRILQVLVCLGMLTCFLCHGHLKTGIPQILASTHIGMPNWIQSWHCANLIWFIPACTRCLTS